MTVPKPLPTSDNTPKIRHFDFSTDECHHYPVDMLVKDFALDILAVFPLYGHFDCLFCRIIHRQVSGRWGELKSPHPSQYIVS